VFIIVDIQQSFDSTINNIWRSRILKAYTAYMPFAVHATTIMHYTFCARRQQGLDKLRLPNFILVKETLETVENGAT
jgi:hypothetical protein